MSLYGAMFTGVSGLSAQGEKIGIISDNIANVNTVGYKQARANFETMVVNAASTTAYSPGGARVNTAYDVDKQGLLTSTSAPTDVAISGAGFFSVNAATDGSGQPLYTRAGSFRQDELGNFKNAAGFFLQGWPLDREGRLPGEPGNANTISASNIESLETINVESQSGVASATTAIGLGMNLNAGESVFPGSSGTITMDIFSANNYQISANDIIVPDETSSTNPSFGLATTNNIARGDKFTVTTGNGLTYDYQYGGFTIGRDLDISGAANIGDGLTDLTPTAFVGGEVVTDGATNLITVTTAAAHGLTTGDSVVLSNITWAGAETIPLTEVNASQIVTVTGANTFTFNSTTASTVADSNVAGAWTTRPFTGNILDATSSTQAFLGTTGLTNFTTASRSFTISTPSVGSTTFTYVTSSPSSARGEFNNLSNLATAISQVTGLTSRVVDGRIVIGADDATESVTFANGDATGTSTLKGIDWVSELGVADVATSSRTFSTLNGLANLVNADAGITAVLDNPLGDATLDIRVDNPLDTIQITDFVGTSQTLAAGSVVTAGAAAGVASTLTVTLAGHGFSVGDNVIFQNMSAFDGYTAAELNTTHTILSTPTANTFTISITAAGATAPAGGNTDGTLAATNVGSLLAEFGLVSSLQGGAYVQGDTGILGPVYDSAGSVGKNLASGDLTAQFSRSTRIYDALGTGHDVRFSYIKTDINKWALEVHAVIPDEVSTSLVDGQIAVGTIEFNGDGSLRSVSSSLLGDITVNWTNGAEPSVVALDFGTAGVPFGTANATVFGDTNGMTQFDSNYNVAFVNQNGAPVGELVSVGIDESGFVIANYSNGENQSLFKLPIADFVNPNGLRPITGNVFAKTKDSGELNLRQAGENGTGNVVSSSLEQSNVDLAEQLTDMIVAQRAYQANTRVISTTDELLKQLNNL